MFRTGQEIGLYTLIKRIGRGGFGEVWLAERRAKFVTTKVAVKLPLDEQVDHEAIKSEAVLWEKASGHPNVLPIIDADEYDGQVVIVSEYAPDGSLEELLQKQDILPTKRAIELTIGILSGLEFLHNKKIIHRDIKPANILLQGETPRLADFGISRVIKASSLSVNVSGTPHYMAPEAFDRKRTAQTDIWSVGVILYQMLKGSLPFPYDNITDLLGAIIMNEPESFADSVPHRLQEIVLKALAKNPDERYQNSREMRDDLSDFLIGISQQSLQPTLKASEQTKSKSTNLPAETQVSPTMRSPGFDAGTAGQRLAETQPSNEIPKLQEYESHRPKSSFRYFIILVPIAVLILLITGAGLIYLATSRLTNTANTIPNSTKAEALIPTKPGKKKIRYIFVGTSDLAKNSIRTD